MSNIICSLEDWDSIFDYHRPNGSSPTWYIKELKTLSIPLMWGPWNVLSEDGEMFTRGFFINAITPEHSRLIKYVPKAKLGTSPHIYIINVYTRTFFETNRSIGFSCISSEYLNDIRNGKCKILMFFIYEGYSGSDGNNDFEVIEEWRIKENLPVNSIYYVCGNLLSEKIVKEKNLGFKARGIHYFETWNKYHGGILNFNPVDNKNLFLSYNRQYRYHRIKLIIDLYENNLIDRGLISVNKIEDVPYDVSENTKRFLLEQTPIHIDSVQTLKYNLAINITTEDYEKTFVSLVTETMAEKNTLFFSEKIWKPIMVGHPFLLLGNLGSLRYLKSLGYKTFDRWFDESYDDEPEMEKRCIMIVNELNKYKTKSVDELKQIRYEMNEVCEYNYNHYKKLYKEKYGDTDESATIRDTLIEIWNEINV